jgi:hypothetical protein
MTANDHPEPPIGYRAHCYHIDRWERLADGWYLLPLPTGAAMEHETPLTGRHQCRVWGLVSYWS